MLFYIIVLLVLIGLGGKFIFFVVLGKVYFKDSKN